MAALGNGPGPSPAQSGSADPVLPASVLPPPALTSHPSSSPCLKPAPQRSAHRRPQAQPRVGSGEAGGLAGSPSSREVGTLHSQPRHEGCACDNPGRNAAPPEVTAQPTPAHLCLSVSIRPALQDSRTGPRCLPGSPVSPHTPPAQPQDFTCLISATPALLPTPDDHTTTSLHASLPVGKCCTVCSQSDLRVILPGASSPSPNNPDMVKSE